MSGQVEELEAERRAACVQEGRRALLHHVNQLSHRGRNGSDTSLTGASYVLPGGTDTDAVEDGDDVSTVGDVGDVGGVGGLGGIGGVRRVRGRESEEDVDAGLQAMSQKISLDSSDLNWSFAATPTTAIVSPHQHIDFAHALERTQRPPMVGNTAHSIFDELASASREQVDYWQFSPPYLYVINLFKAISCSQHISHTLYIFLLIPRIVGRSSALREGSEYKTPLLHRQHHSSHHGILSATARN